MVSLSQFFTKLKWKILPGSSPARKEEARKWAEIFDEISQMTPMTEEEDAELDETLKQRYMKELHIPLFKHDANRVTNDEKWQSTILSLRSLPVSFRVKIIETDRITEWQSSLEQGVYGTYFVFPGQGAISYDEIEWLELNASELSQNEMEHFGDSMHETKVMQCHILSSTMQIRRLYGYFKSPKNFIDE